MAIRKIFLAFSLITALIPSYLKSQSVSTLIDVNSIRINDGMVQGAQGQFFGSSYTSGQIYKFDLQSNVSLLASGLSTSNGLFIDSNGDLLAADPDGNRILKIDTANGAFLDTINIHSPAAMAKIPGNDTLLVTDWRANKIYKLAPDGSSTTYFSGAPLNAPVGIAYLPAEQSIIVANFNDRKLYRIKNDSLQYIATIPALNTSGNKWLGFIACSADRLFATSLNSHTLYEVHYQYVDSVQLICGIPGLAGQKDGSLDSATFNLPNGVLSIGGDSLLISDYGSGKVRLVQLEPRAMARAEYPKLKAKVELFPNPNQGQLTIRMDASLIDELRLYNTDGVLLLSKKNLDLKAGQCFLQLPELKVGVYILHLQVDAQIFNSKIWIEN